MVMFAIRLPQLLISMMVWHLWTEATVGSVRITFPNHLLDMLPNILGCFRNHNFCEIIQILKKHREINFSLVVAVENWNC